MAYLRWSFSEWYVYAHVDGGLWIGFRGKVKDAGCYSTGNVMDFLSGRRKLEEIAGFSAALPSERKELLWSMREYVADEMHENLNAPLPNYRQLLRNSGQKPGDDRDPKFLREPETE